MIYGEKFKILSKKRGWLKVVTDFDKYTGYIKNKKYPNKFLATHKICTLEANIFSFPKNSNKYKKNNKLPFGSKIEILKKYKKFIMYEKNKWIKIKNVKKYNFKEKDFVKILNLFINCKYKWGGKSFNGIDCSALLQMYYFYNNRYFPRDTKDQIKIKKGNRNLNSFVRGNIIYWKGHVAICINSKKLIHAYGPKKKVLIMNIKDTIKIIEKTANLKVKKIIKI